MVKYLNIRKNSWNLRSWEKCKTWVTKHKKKCSTFIQYFARFHLMVSTKGKWSSGEICWMLRAAGWVQWCCGCSWSAIMEWEGEGSGMRCWAGGGGFSLPHHNLTLKPKLCPCWPGHFWGNGVSSPGLLCSSSWMGPLNSWKEFLVFTACSV